MKSVAGKIKGDLAQYREVQAFSQFASDLDKATRDQLNRGTRLVELMKQAQYQPFPVEKQIISIYAATNGFLDDLPVESVRRFESELLSFVEERYPDVPETLSDETTGTLKTAITAFKGQFKP